MASLARAPVALAFVACAGSSEVLTPPSPPTTGFTFTFLADTADAGTAAALGWEGGLPGLAVTLTPADSSRPPRSFTTDGAGQVTIPDLVAGDYVVEASRWLTAPERTALPSDDDTDGFTVHVSIHAGSAGDAATIPVRASRRHSLLISEWAYAPLWTPLTGTYEFGGYIELYNNADSTLYLDGMLLGEAWTQGVSFSETTCADVASVTSDSQGLWVRKLARFPGAGHDFPLSPGRTAVVATDAIDHRTLTPGGLDLSGADFEFMGPSDVDNPAVPNLIDVGLFSSFTGHGMTFDIDWSVPFLALPQDISQLQRQRPPFFNNGAELLLIPRATLLDMAAFLTTYDFPVPLCDHLVSPVLDAATARLIIEVNATLAEVWSVHRRRADPSSVLQDTGKSDADFEIGRRTPGTLGR